MKQISFFILSFLLATASFGQYNLNENKKWVFGSLAGVNFSSGSPVAFTSAMSSGEGCASVADGAGNLLFYTEGTKVWNRSHAVMPGGSAIVSFGTSSSTQGALIAPVIGNPNQYYVFSMEDYGSGSIYCRLAYCIVDMTLDGGMGDVVASSLGTSLGNQWAEKMILVPGNNCNLWFVTHRTDSTKFYAFSIDASGIGAPVISTVGSFSGTNSYCIGVLKVSPNRLKIASQVYPTSSTQGTELYDFDPNTGIVSNCQVLDNARPAYGGEFSPDNTKFYSQIWGGVVDQYDVSLSTTAAIIASRTTVISGSTVSDMKLASDGKIYIRSPASGATLDCISNPNAAGSGCGYTTSAVSLTSGSSGTLGFPNTFVASGGGGDTSKKRYDTTLCIPTTGVLLNADTTGTGYFWNDGTILASNTAFSPGIYWVRITNGCRINIDTFVITSALFDSSIRRVDTAVCFPPGGITLNAGTTGAAYTWSDGGASFTSNPFTLVGTYWVNVVNGCSVNIDSFFVTSLPVDTTKRATTVAACIDDGAATLTAPTGYTSFLWSTGSTATSITTSTTGAYYVYSSAGCDLMIDTFNVTFIPHTHTEVTSDSAYCFPGKLTLNATTGFASYAWQNGANSPSFSATGPGTYYVTGTSFCADNVDSFHVVLSTLTFNLGPDTTVCMNYMIDAPVKGDDVSYLWQDGSTASYYSAPRSGQYVVVITKGGCVATDTINVKFFHFSQNIPDTFICKGTPIDVTLQCNVPQGGSVMWNDGVTTPTRTVHDSGSYWVIIKKDECAILDSVHITTGYCNCWVQVPQAFTPNSDGLNDLFKPSIEPGCTISGYQLSVFNRWGELVFISDFRNNGWDGMYKGMPADMGVYMYSLQFFVGVDDKPTYRTGSVTLIR